MFGREPVAIVNAVRLSLLAAITFGLHLSDVQLVASMAALEAVLTLLARSQVVPVVTHEAHLDHLVTITSSLPVRDRSGRLVDTSEQSTSSGTSRDLSISTEGPADSPERGAVELVTVLIVAALVIAIACGLRYLGVI